MGRKRPKKAVSKGTPFETAFFHCLHLFNRLYESEIKGFSILFLKKIFIPKGVLFGTQLNEIIVSQISGEIQPFL